MSEGSRSSILTGYSGGQFWAGFLTPRRRGAANCVSIRRLEVAAEWSATGPENRCMVMSHRRSIRLPSAKFAQVREPGRNGSAVTRSPRVGRGGSTPPLCTSASVSEVE